MAVSYALRHHPSIPETTRQRVLEVARNLGYQRDPALEEAMRVVRARREGRQVFRGTLAYLNLHAARADLYSPYSRALLAGAHARCATLGYKLEECWAGDVTVSPSRTAAILTARGIAGLLLPPAPVDAQVPFAWPDCHAVSMTYSVPDLPWTRVVPHHQANIQCLLHKMAKLGYRRMLLVTDVVQEKRTNNTSVAVFEWFQRHVQRQRPQVRLLPPREPNESARPWKLPRDIDAVITPDLWLLDGLRRASRSENSFPVPPHIGLATYGMRYPGVSGIDVCMRIIGEVAVDTLVAQLRQPRSSRASAPSVIMIEGRWSQSRSTPERRRAI